MRLEFSIPLHPDPKRRPTVVYNFAARKRQWASRPKDNGFKSHLLFHVQAQMRARGLKPFAGGVCIAAVMEFNYFTKDAKKWGQYKPTRPDLDNLIKAIKDNLNAVAYVDDGQIVKLESCKRWAREDSIKIVLEDCGPALFAETEVPQLTVTLRGTSRLRAALAKQKPAIEAAMKTAVAKSLKRTRGGDGSI